MKGWEFNTSWFRRETACRGRRCLRMGRTVSIGCRKLGRRPDRLSRLGRPGSLRTASAKMYTALPKTQEIVGRVFR